MQYATHPTWQAVKYTLTQRILAFTVGVILISSLLAACGPASSQAESNTAPAAPASTASENAPDTGTTLPADVAGVVKLNLNTATEEEFLTVPNVGARMVREFLEYRPYVSIQQFRREIGKYVDEAQVAAYEQYVYVPVNVNEADAETLQQLPGVDATMAAALIAGRPYADNAAFLAKLATVVPNANLAAAGAYLESE
jgi:DNA uptake protein ComE-like DNA-binding protein